MALSCYENIMKIKAADCSGFFQKNTGQSFLLPAAGGCRELARPLLQHELILFSLTAACSDLFQDRTKTRYGSVQKQIRTGTGSYWGQGHGSDRKLAGPDPSLI